MSNRKYEHLLEEWIELYTEEELPVPGISDRYEASQDTVNRYLREAGVNIRGGHVKEYKHLADEWVELYTEKEMSTYEIADQYKPTPLTISRYLQDAGVEIRGDGNQDLDLPVGEWAHLYRDRHYTVKQIANAYDRDRGIVRKHLKQAGVKTDPHRSNKYPVDEWIQLYTEEDLSACKIADRYSCGRSTVIKRLRSEGVEITNENKLTKESLLKKVDQSGECWIWKGAPSAQRYGQFSINGSNIPAHRAVYRVWKDEIPDGHYVRHKCDNRQCVRPEHLTTGTHDQNMNDIKQTNKELESLTPEEMQDIIESDDPWHEIAEERGLRIGTVRILKSSS